MRTTPKILTIFTALLIASSSGAMKNEDDDFDFWVNNQSRTAQEKVNDINDYWERITFDDQFKVANAVTAQLSSIDPFYLQDKSYPIDICSRHPLWSVLCDLTTISVERNRISYFKAAMPLINGFIQNNKNICSSRHTS